MHEFVMLTVVLGLLALALLIVVVTLLGRRIVLTRRLGAFDCSLYWERVRDMWVYGLARYERDRLHWYRLVDVSMRPARSLNRGQLTILERRRPDDPNAALPTPDWVLVRCSYEEDTLELGMSESAYNGLATWLESAPPGEHPLLT